MSSVEVTSLHIYPVKSCAGIDLSSADISPKGFEHDRNWMIVDPQGTKITQRECPEMVSIKPELRGGALELHADGIESLHIELNPLYLSPREVDIWGHRCVALDEGNRAARWISEVLKNDLRIVRFHPEHTRLVDTAWSGYTGAQTGFADMLPFLITSEESLSALNEERYRRGLLPAPMSRFRPNIVIKGAGPYGEDHIPALKLPGTGAKLELVRPCSRCGIVDIDQDTGIKESRGNLTILGTQRRFKNYRGEAGAMFGVQALPMAADGETLSIGDILTTEELSEGLPSLPRLR